MFSMASTPESPPATSIERASTPKAYGAVHAASGCGICRLCREQCYEQFNDQDVCSTCARFQIKYLGFGTKYPDSLTKSPNVVQLSETKGTLASHQMVEIHSDSSAREPEQSDKVCLSSTSTESTGSSPGPLSRSQTPANNDARHHSAHTSLVVAASPPTKRAGVPKVKSAVHAKSACYTCRIRRKRCDEQFNEHGHCSTCVRLRLECLGFGAKRHEWLRENQNAVLLRNKIKNFLASQGMIKSHPGSGARSSEQPAILRLTLESNSTPYHSSSLSPPSPPPRALPNNDHPPRRGMWGSSYDHCSYPSGSATASEHRSASPQSTEGNSPHLTSPSTVQPFPRSIQYRSRPNLPPLRQIQPYKLANRMPAMQSAFGNSHNLPHHFFASTLPSEEQIDHLSRNDSDNVYDADESTSPANTAGTHPLPLYVDIFQQPNDLNPLLLRYMTDVVTTQYPLITDHLRALIVNATVDGQQSTSEPTTEQQAVALLSYVIYFRFAHPTKEPVLLNPDIRLRLLEIEKALNKNIISCEDAMAALHLISLTLFAGGCGQWRQYLEIASGYVRARLGGLSYNADRLEELRKLSEKEAFIVKVTIWFDIFASVTMKRRPLLMNIIKFSFQSEQSGLEELASSSSDAVVARISDPDEEKSSMMSSIGCQNRVVWALAEINALAAWARDSKERGRLSVKELVQRSSEIERELEIRHHHTIRILSDFNDDPIVYSRYIVSNIFRASAMLYLHSVVSGGYPHVVQIKSSVDEVMRWIRRIPKKPITECDKKIHKSVIRSTVFGFYITGALTDDVKHRKLIHEYLLEEAGEHVGNIHDIATILDQIWKERGGGPGAWKSEVAWREMLSSDREPVLLV